MAFAQDAAYTSMVTLGAGGLPYSNVYSPQHGGPSFTGDYEYRLSRYLALEAGTDILLPAGGLLQEASILSGENLISYYNSSCPPSCTVLESGRSRVTLLTYGFKGILPLVADRIELFAGIGGAYGWNSEFGGRLDSAYGQASLGARFAVDRGHHFWLGTSVRGFYTFGPEREAWLPWTFDLGIRFGH